jgi:hypothetical protein
MHYCQRCDVPVAMRPQSDLAQCPACGSTERALRLPLFVVTGASGSGKTTVHPYVVAALPDCVVFDVDWLIDPFEAASRPINWAALRDAWVSVAHGVAQGGRHTVLLGSFMPEQLLNAPARMWVADIHFRGSRLRRRRPASAPVHPPAVAGTRHRTPHQFRRPPPQDRPGRHSHRRQPRSRAEPIAEWVRSRT